MNIRFSKYQCAGNDFILTENQAICTQDIITLCNRRFGIGADGLIIIKASQDNFAISFYNPDGSGDTLCGNGSLCSVDYAIANNIAKNDTFEASDGLHCFKKSPTLEISMRNCPQAQYIPIPKDTSTQIFSACKAFFINTGSPHYVIFTDSTDKIDILKTGRFLRNSINTENGGCNVDFVEITGVNTLKIITYERGVEDETLGCGTGSVAAALSYATIKNLTEGKIELCNKGGFHNVSFAKKTDMFTDIFLGGKPLHVFDGEIIL
ncbi:MAG: diaminopimelate epimerase [Bacteroidales bacterium]|nr:diaminopimelate epimerase [Bacteroidales bacterium]